MLKLGCFGEEGRRKEKESWEGKADRMATAHFLVYVATEFHGRRALPVATGRAGQVHDRAYARVTGMLGLVSLQGWGWD